MFNINGDPSLSIVQYRNTEILNLELTMSMTSEMIYFELVGTLIVKKINILLCNSHIYFRNK